MSYGNITVGHTLRGIVIMLAVLSSWLAVSCAVASEADSTSTVPPRPRPAAVAPT